MLLHIPGVFTKDEVATLRQRLDAGPWADGNATSGHQAAGAKVNRQLPEDSPEAREVGALVGERWEAMETFVQRARGADHEAAIRPEALAAIEAARRAGCRLAILSNELDLFYGADFRRRLPFMAAFDVVVDATHTGILKPDARAYRQCLDELGLPAEACVFVDDQLRNIAGAERVGLRCVHFDVMQPAASYAQALALLGIPSSSSQRP